LKKVRVLPKMFSRDKRHESNQFNSFIFCEKSSGLAKFQAESTSDLKSTVERMASLLAMQCLVRGSEPTDFAILVPAEQTLANRLASRAKELLEEGRAVANPDSLSPRQKEILQSVICNKANKEIASKLNITVRTVKFHISSLLNKFGVENRAELARRASGFLRSTMLREESFEFKEPLQESRSRELGPIALNSAAHLASKERSLRFPQRVMSA
jgi:DNA-binding CsgD family transcriptional regulator